MTLNIEALRNEWAWAEKQNHLRLQGMPNEWEQGTWYIDRMAELDHDYETTAPPEETGFDDFSLPHYTQMREVAVTCNTACCIAGHYTTVTRMLEPASTINNYSADSVVDTDGETKSMSFVAQQGLGLDASQAAALFQGDNSISMVRDLLVDWGVITNDEAYEAEQHANRIAREAAA